MYRISNSTPSGNRRRVDRLVKVIAEKVMIMDNFLAAEPKILRRALDVVRAFLRRFRLTPSSDLMARHAQIVFYRIFFHYIMYM